MPIHRLKHKTTVQFIDIHPPHFSSFDFIEDNYGDFGSLRRLFSLARSHNAKTLSVETIPATGIITEENDDISKIYPDYSMKRLKRLAFWDISVDNIKDVNDSNLIGYAIIKLDYTENYVTKLGRPNKEYWHVFESVFKKYEHEHNCVPYRRQYKVFIADRKFTMHGIMYCQQNGLNKACAHVALRAILDGLPNVDNLSYRQLNQLAGNPARPGLGLNVAQIRNVLYGLNIPFRDIDYSEGEKNEGKNLMRETLPYRKFVYTGVESGIGALLGFHLAKPDTSVDDQPKHIIPFFGHTFNKDTWVPDAALNYFEIGSDIGYIPSDNWTNSFIGHDDNFGSDFCVPKLYVKRDQVDYVVELLKPQVMYSGVQAEAMSLIFLYSLFPQMRDSKNRWMNRLASWADPGVKKVVLRAISLSCDEYIDHLIKLEDWKGNKEYKKVTNVLRKGVLPSQLWMIEVSIPHLFPANERKLGEIILDASRLPTETKKAVDFSLFVMARLPGKYFFSTSFEDSDPDFIEIPSQIKSHVPLFNQFSQ